MKRLRRVFRAIFNGTLAVSEKQPQAMFSGLTNSLPGASIVDQPL
jgi:hypothetical protein